MTTPNSVFKTMNPLIQHACEGHVQEVQALLAQGNEFDHAAMMGAAMAGQHEYLALFLPVEEKHWSLALLNATMEGHEKCVQLLLDRQPAQWHDGVGRALTDGVIFKHPHCTQVFLEHIEHTIQKKCETL